MGFGLCNAPATFAQVINLVMRGLNWRTTLAFLDDILTMCKDFQDHQTNLREAFGRFRQYDLKLKVRKCAFFFKRVEFLGRFVSENSIVMAETDIETVKNCPMPSCSKDVERFLCLANYQRSFIRIFARITVHRAQENRSLLGKKINNWPSMS